MPKKSQSGDASNAAGEFVERLERGSALSDVCTSKRQLRILQGIASDAERTFRLIPPRALASGVATSLGPAALFAGSDANARISAVAALGKTLERDVLRIDLTRVVSKYIGETEKNLRRLFDATKQSKSILFFDEAEALFGKRSEVKDSHDRYANLEIGYFLGRAETYGGLVILSSRTAKGLSEAVLRRVAAVVEFPARPNRRKSR